MPINYGSRDIKEIVYRNQQIAEVYRGTDTEPFWKKTPPWAFEDDFERSSIGSAWNGSGGLIDNGSLKKNSSAGSADYRINQEFATDDLLVEVVLGPVDVGNIRASILLGPGNNMVYIEFEANGGVIGQFYNNRWTTLTNLPSKPGGYTAGDVMTVQRVGSLVTLSVNGSFFASATSEAGRGPGNRIVGLSVRATSSWLLTRYGPTFDAVRVREL